MCGRYKMTAGERAYLKKFGFLNPEEYFDIHGFSKKPEIFPGQQITAGNKDHRLEDIRWTIEDLDSYGRWQRAINARAETIMKVPMFREAFRQDRILIPATGIFEWQIQPDGTKKKYELSFDEPLFAFAGIARDCTVKGETCRSGVIITTVANPVFREIHNSKFRQPVIIREEDYEQWLDPKTPLNDLIKIMRPIAAEQTRFKLADEIEAITQAES